MVGEHWPMLCPEGTVNLFGVHKGKVALQSGPVSGPFQAGEGVLFRGRGEVMLTARTGAECALLRLRGEAAEQFCDLLEYPVCRWENGGKVIWNAAQEDGRRTTRWLSWQFRWRLISEPISSAMSTSASITAPLSSSARKSSGRMPMITVLPT